MGVRWPETRQKFVAFAPQTLTTSHRKVWKVCKETGMVFVGLLSVVLSQRDHGVDRQSLRGRYS